MKLFTKRITPAENISFLAIMAAVNVFVSLLGTFVPLSSLFTVLFLPLASALVGLLADKKYLIPYVVATIFLTLITTFYSPSDTILYVIPAILSGVLLGFLSNKGLPFSFLIFAVGLLNLGLNYLSLPIINALTGIDFLVFARQILRLNDFASYYDYVPLVFLLYSFAEAALASIILNLFSERLDIKRKSLPYGGIIFSSVSILFSLLGLGIGFINIAVSLLLLGIAFYGMVITIIELINEKEYWAFLAIGILELLSLYLFAFLYQKMPTGTGLCLSSFFIVSPGMTYLVTELLKFIKKKYIAKNVGK